MRQRTRKPPKTALTPEQVQRIHDLRNFPAKRQKVADILIAADLAEEAELHQKAAAKALAEAEWFEKGQSGILLIHPSCP